MKEIDEEMFNRKWGKSFSKQEYEEKENKMEN